MKSNQKINDKKHDSKAIANSTMAKKGSHVNLQQTPRIQTKLTIGSPDDEYEKEADQVATQVMKMPEPIVSRQAEEEEEIQAKPMDEMISRQEEEEEAIQAKPTGEMISRQEEEEEMIQAKPIGEMISRQEEEEEMIQAKDAESQNQSSVATSSLENSIQRSKGGGSSMPDGVRNSMESRFNADFSRVSIHNNSEANMLARQVNAQAFTHGNDIYFGAGKYSPGSGGGRGLLAHELTHVVQQNPGVVKRKINFVNAPSGTISRSINSISAGNLVQRNITSDFYGESWEAYVYPGKAKPIINGETKKRDKKAEEERSLRGERVRDFQRYNKRKVTVEGDKKIITIGSTSFDKKEKTTSFGDTEISQVDTSFDKDTPAEWSVDLTRNMLFDGTPKPEDLAQRLLGDCYLLAVLQGMARSAGGKTHLQNIIKASGNNYSVEFFRLKMAGKQAFPDPKARIRVSVSKKKNAAASAFAYKGAKPLTAAEIAEIKTKNNSSIKPSDNVTGMSHKYVTWPWAVEKAYATVVGSYKKISGGYAGMPIMVLLGQLAGYRGDLHKGDDKATKSLFIAMQDELARGTTITAQTLDEKELNKNKYSNDILISRATAAGIRIYSLVDLANSQLLPWAWFDKYVDSFYIINFLKGLSGKKGAILNSKTLEGSPKDAVIAAASSTWTMIPAKMKNHLMFNRAGKLAAPNHVYSMQSATPTKATAFNPWGHTHLDNMSRAQFKAIFHHIFFNTP